MQASSDSLEPRAVLGAVKAQPGNAGASRKPSATAGLDRPCARRDRRSVGRDEGTAPWLEQKELRDRRSKR
jgi:hypothetical protein